MNYARQTGQAEFARIITNIISLYYHFFSGIIYNFYFVSQSINQCFI
jgi:hypothetical protein